MTHLARALSAAILIALGTVQVAPVFAQDATPENQGAESDESSRTRQAIAWSRDKLAELDADIAVLEKDAAKKRGEARIEAQAAISELRQIRDEYRSGAEQTARNAETWSDEQLLSAKKTLDANWAEFQAGLDGYLDKTRATVATRQELLDAELKVRREAWRKRISELKADADDLAAAEGEAINARIDALEVQTEASKERVARLQEASRESWGVARQGYAEVQQTFSNTYASIRKSIEAASAKEKDSGDDAKEDKKR